MERHNLKQYIVALSTVSMLNGACSLGPNRLGMMDNQGGLSSGTTADNSKLGTEAVFREEDLLVYINLHGVGKNRDGGGK
ncbi:hypothetical protein [Candidatus Cardinium hertigii]|uniref:hypothetical protein n=1 Tax=Candidatus Cardinium hertigii TaxID=247481 RepID=UPI001FAA5B2B|nr:hypothetical protein [Candidatus Cardinium hertigii]